MEKPRLRVLGLEVPLAPIMMRRATVIIRVPPSYKRARQAFERISRCQLFGRCLKDRQDSRICFCAKGDGRVNFLSASSAMPASSKNCARIKEAASVSISSIERSSLGFSNGARGLRGRLSSALTACSTSIASAASARTPRCQVSVDRPKVPADPGRRVRPDFVDYMREGEHEPLPRAIASAVVEILSSKERNDRCARPVGGQQISLHACQVIPLIALLDLRAERIHTPVALFRPHFVPMVSNAHRSDEPRTASAPIEFTARLSRSAEEISLNCKRFILARSPPGG